jgi:hypothetical protein
MLPKTENLIVLVREEALVYWSKDPAPNSVMMVVCRVIYQQQLKLQYGLPGHAVRPFYRIFSSR